MDNKIKQNVELLCTSLSCTIFGTVFNIKVEPDKISGDRLYIQLRYMDRDHKDGQMKIWSGRKWYLSEFMTDDEIVKTVFSAFEAAVRHELLEGFRFGGVAVFNPHANFRQLMLASSIEVVRPNIKYVKKKTNIKNQTDS